MPASGSVRVYESGDLEKLDGILHVSAEELVASSMNLDALIDAVPHAAVRFARTLIAADGHPIACFGVYPQHKGCGRAWAVLTQESLEQKKLLYCSVRSELEGFEQREDFHRIESVGRLSQPELGAWFAHLGFERETGIHGMRGYGLGGEPYHLYARVDERYAAPTGGL